MGKYSSESDTEKYSKKKHRRRSSSSSDDSRSRRRKSKKVSRHRSRSHSRDRHHHSRTSNEYKHQKSSSSSSRRRRSRSSSRDYKKSHSRRSSRSRRSSSPTKSYITEFVSRSNRSPSSSSSTTSDDSDSADYRSNQRQLKQTTSIQKKSKEAHRSIDQTKSDEEVILDAAAVDEINSEGFAQKSFVSNKKMENIVIDLKKQTIKVPEVEQVEPDSIFHHNLFLNEEARMEKWVKELFTYRQKALQQGMKN